MTMSTHSSFNSQSSQDHCLKRGSMVLVNMPNGRTPDTPGNKLQPAMVWNVRRDMVGDVDRLDLLWVSYPRSLSKQEAFLKDGQIISRGYHAYTNLGFNNPVIIDTNRLISVPVNDAFFPSVPADRKTIAVANDVRSTSAIHLSGFASEGFVKAIERTQLKAQKDSVAKLGRIKEGTVVLVNLPNGNTPHIPGEYTKPALVWDVYKNDNKTIDLLGLRWMRPFRESKDIQNALREHHVMVSDPYNYKRMGLDRPAIIDTSHVIKVSARPEFFPKANERRYGDVKYCVDATSGSPIAILGQMDAGLQHGVIAKVAQNYKLERQVSAAEAAQAAENAELDKFAKEFGLDKLKLRR